MLEASVSLAWWLCSQGYHLNNTGSLMTARPRAVTVRLLSACPVAAGDVGVCRAQAESVRCCVLGWAGGGATQSPMIISQPAVCVKWTKQASRHHAYCLSIFCHVFRHNTPVMIFK